MLLPLEAQWLLSDLWDRCILAWGPSLHSLLPRRWVRLAWEALLLA